jgi:transposase InsO family protein
MAESIGRAPFSQETITAFQNLYDNASYTNRQTISAETRFYYRQFLNNNSHPITGTKEQKQRLYTLKNRALKYFELRDGQLYRQAEGHDPAKYVICTYEKFERISLTHCNLGHPGTRKTFEALTTNYYGVTRAEVAWLLERCQVCLMSRKSTTKAPLTPIVSGQILERVQIDLMDFRAEPDGVYHWILHIKDHFSKYTVLRALKTKHSQEVANELANFVADFGVPIIMQADNGTEFKGILTALLQDHGIHIINGRPRHPQSQGLVEQGNGVAKTKLRAIQEETGWYNWASQITEVQMAMNLQSHSSLPNKMSPYEVMFGRKPRWIDSIPLHIRRMTEILEEEIETREEQEERYYTEEDTDENDAMSNRDIDPSLLTPTTQLEDEIAAHQDSVRLRMANSFARRGGIEVFAIDDIVTVQVPRQDRDKLDTPRIPAVVVSVPHEHTYELRTEFGTLKRKYPTAELLRVPDQAAAQLRIQIGSTVGTITLRKAAQLSHVNRTGNKILPVRNSRKRSNTIVVSQPAKRGRGRPRKNA